MLRTAPEIGFGIRQFVESRWTLRECIRLGSGRVQAACGCTLAMRTTA